MQLINLHQTCLFGRNQIFYVALPPLEIRLLRRKVRAPHVFFGTEVAIAAAHREAIFPTQAYDNDFDRRVQVYPPGGTQLRTAQIPLAEERNPAAPF
ncbi:hypothetical protein ABH995_000871 [Bradyrhizobium yuanmingense]